jgi:hypothetical protein
LGSNTATIGRCVCRIQDRTSTTKLSKNPSKRVACFLLHTYSTTTAHQPSRSKRLVALTLCLATIQPIHPSKPKHVANAI